MPAESQPLFCVVYNMWSVGFLAFFFFFFSNGFCGSLSFMVMKVVCGWDRWKE